MLRHGRICKRWIIKPTGTGAAAQGVMLFWDDTLQAYVPTDADELIWDDTNKAVQPVTMNVRDTSGNIVFHVDDAEMYFTSGAIPIEAGMPIGLALALTYAS